MNKIVMAAIGGLVGAGVYYWARKALAKVETIELRVKYTEPVDEVKEDLVKESEETEIIFNSGTAEASECLGESKEEGNI